MAWARYRTIARLIIAITSQTGLAAGREQSLVHNNNNDNNINNNTCGPVVVPWLQYNTPYCL